MRGGYMRCIFKELREKKGLTEAQVATALNVPLSEYLSYETGKKTTCNTMKFTLINFLL